MCCIIMSHDMELSYNTNKSCKHLYLLLITLPVIYYITVCVSRDVNKEGFWNLFNLDYWFWQDIIYIVINYLIITTITIDNYIYLDYLLLTSHTVKI